MDNLTQRTSVKLTVVTKKNSELTWCLPSLSTQNVCFNLEQEKMLNSAYRLMILMGTVWVLLLPWINNQISMWLLFVFTMIETSVKHDGKTYTSMDFFLFQQLPTKSDLAILDLAYIWKYLFCIHLQNWKHFFLVPNRNGTNNQEKCSTLALQTPIT